MTDPYWDAAYGIAPPENATLPPTPEPTPHVGPAADDYAAINERLKKLEAERAANVQATPLPEVTPVTLKPWWR